MHVCSAKRNWKCAEQHFNVGSVVVCNGSCPHPIALRHHDLNRSLGKEPKRALRDRIEDRLRIRERTTDHTENLRGRPLMLKRFREFCRTRLQTFEQADIFDRDHRLVCKRGCDSHLLFRERPQCSTKKGNNPDGFSLAHQRDTNAGPKTRHSGEFLRPKFTVRHHIGDVHRFPLEHCPPSHSSPTSCQNRLTRPLPSRELSRILRSSRMQQLAQSPTWICGA